MPINIIVCAKQVMDPETPVSAFKVDREAKRVVPATGIPPVVNGFDENAVEAALRLKEKAGGGKITILSLGKSFVNDVIKKPLAMGGDELVLLQEDAFEGLDAFTTVQALVAAIKKIGQYDLILCGRQASDYDQAHVPHGIGEMLGLPVISMAANLEVKDGAIHVERKLPDGYEVLEAPMPAVVSVSNELTPVRLPNLRGIMAASRKQPTVWKAADVGLEASALRSGLELLDLFIPVSEKVCEFIDGENDEDKGRKLALRLREAKLI
ncbi:MAG: electron transfer flavoprotein beta subunit/FixA family protein [Dehalococcoidia bacterium]|nr:electron transfer flavoprotein beta subunit/FixA family protein [Dehalococcoidia bacterium]